MYDATADSFYSYNWLNTKTLVLAVLEPAISFKLEFSKGYFKKSSTTHSI